jgi:hypothetical protein
MTADVPDLDWAEPAARTYYARVPEWLLDREDLSPFAKTAYAVLARHINRKSGQAFPGMDRLAAKVGCGEDRLRAALRELQGWREGDDTKDRGTWQGPQILTSKRRGLGMTNLYRLCFEDPSASETRQDRVPDPDDTGFWNPTPGGTNQTEKNQTEKNQTAAAARATEPAFSQEADDAARMLQEAGVQILDGGFLQRLAVTHPQVDLIEVARIAIQRHRTGGIRGSRDRYIAGIVTGDNPPVRAKGRAGLRVAGPTRPSPEQKAEIARTAGPAEDALWLEVTGGAA